GVTAEWLLTGREPFPTGGDEAPPAPKVPVVGYVGAGPAPPPFDVAQPRPAQGDGPARPPRGTGAAEVPRRSPGPIFNPPYGILQPLVRLLRRRAPPDDA